MGDESLNRLEALRAACIRLGFVKPNGEPSPGQLGKAIDRETNYCSDLLHGRRSFGEDIARHIEEKLHLGRWALDGGAGWPFPGIDRTEFDSLTRDQQIEIQGLVRAAIARFHATSATQGKTKQMRA